MRNVPHVPRAASGGLANGADVVAQWQLLRAVSKMFEIEIENANQNCIENLRWTGGVSASSLDN